MTKIRKKNKVDNCELCNKEFEHYSWDKQRYCSKDCAWKKSKVEETCLVCNKITLKSKSTSNRNSMNYCSRDCYNLRNVATKRLKRGTAFWKNLLESSSCECGETKPYLLQIHHIDGNHSNNNKDNLEIVCPTCHVKRHLKQNKLGEWVYHPKSLTDRNLIKNL
jgi:hypothetical protein